MARIATLVALIAVTVPAWSAVNSSAFVPAAVPTLDEVGLGALIALVAGVAGWAVRKRSGRK